MEIHVERCTDPAFEPTRNDTPRPFVIYWEHEGVYYPDRKWVDFGSVILMWWLAAAIRLLEGSSVEQFLFMEGPFIIQANYEAGLKYVTLDLSVVDIVWMVSVNDFVNALIESAKNAIRVSQNVTGGLDDSPGLLMLVDELENARDGFY